ncbi:MAG: hypothetical protein HYW25_03135 [Candidatus Aenigmarchaeota archaeon]|nr:hypothetical protein [Candidatus Aenigmarchaeota archaeon]
MLMKKYLLAVVSLMLIAGCVGQQKELQYEISEVNLLQENAPHNQSVQMFVTVKSSEDRDFNVSVRISAARTEDAKYLVFDPDSIDYGQLKKGEEVRKSFNVRALIAAGERITYKFKVELIANNTVIDMREKLINVNRE